MIDKEAKVWDRSAKKYFDDVVSPFAEGVKNPIFWHLDNKITGNLKELSVIDIGCGAGMDLLLAAKSVGPRGRAIGVDMTEAMAEKARSSALMAGLRNVEVRIGDAMSLPLEDTSADVVISNGVLNLTPDKSVAYGEAFRILKPGGRFLYADIVVGAELSESIRRDVDLWTG